MSTEREPWLRRHAVQIAAQLPEDRDEALAVLQYCRDLVVTFLTPATGSYPQDDSADHARVIRLRASGTSPSLRASSNGRPSGLPK